MRQIYLGLKFKTIRNPTLKKEIQNKSELFLNDKAQKLLDNYQGDIENFTGMCKLVDCMFEDTKNFYVLKLMVFTFSTLIFLLQIQFVQGEPAKVLITLSLSIEVAFLWLEKIQFDDRG